MYTEDDTMTPRDRISDDMLRRMLGGNGTIGDPSVQHEQNPSNATRKTWGLENYPTAMVYAPLQNFRALYDQDTALKKGTIFSELDLPFLGASIANKGGTCRG